MTTEELNAIIAKAEAGDTAAMNKVAHFYSDDTEFKDLKKAFFWYKKSAELGNINSMANLGGWCYAYGNGTKKNFTLAVEWLKKAAYKGDIWSMRRLAWLYYDIKKDRFEWEWWRKKAADAEHKKEEEAQKMVEAKRQLEEDVRALLQKDPDDLTGREVKRLKELQNDPDVDVEDFLTAKEYKKFLSIVGESKKDDPTEMSLFGHPIQFDKQ